MVRKVLTPFLCLLLSFSNSLLAQSEANIKAERIRRYERMGSGGDAIMEATLDLTRSMDRPVDAVVRVCSREPMPIALMLAAMNPFKVERWLKDIYHYPSERILFLRSEDCLGPNSEVAATELWAVPKGAAFPPFVESIKSSQARLEPVGTKGLLAEGARKHNAAIEKLIEKLRARPEAVGVALGYYYKQPGQVMERRLREVQKALKESGLSKDRYWVRLAPWTGEQPADGSEPKYPSLFIIEIAKDCSQR